VAVHDPSLVICPGCGTCNDRAIAGIRLLEPFGCDETAVVVRCRGCDSFYLEVEESGFSHPEGPDYWTRGPLHPKLAEMALGAIQKCPSPFNSHQVFCRCLGHRFMANFMYARLVSPADDRTPWATEGDVRSRLAWLMTPRLERALTLAVLVHRRQPRDDGVSYLHEHILPVGLEVYDYLKNKLVPAELERAAAVALLHDVLEDAEWAERLATDDELLLIPDVIPPHGGVGASLDVLKELHQTVGEEITATLCVLTKAPKADSGEANEAIPDPRQARYMAVLREASYIAKIVKIFDRLNNLQCVHKNPDKAPGYVEETRRDYLPLANELDHALAKRMATLLSKVEAQVSGERASESRRPAAQETAKQEAHAPEIGLDPNAGEGVAQELTRQLESIAPEAVIGVQYHSMAWARRKMGVPEARPSPERPPPVSPDTS